MEEADCKQPPPPPPAPEKNVTNRSAAAPSASSFLQDGLTPSPGVYARTVKEKELNPFQFSVDKVSCGESRVLDELTPKILSANHITSSPLITNQNKKSSTLASGDSTTFKQPPKKQKYPEFHNESSADQQLPNPQTQESNHEAPSLPASKAESTALQRQNSDSSTPPKKRRTSTKPNPFNFSNIPANFDPNPPADAPSVPEMSLKTSELTDMLAEMTDNSLTHLSSNQAASRVAGSTNQEPPPPPPPLVSNESAAAAVTFVTCIPSVMPQPLLFNPVSHPSNSMLPLTLPASVRHGEAPIISSRVSPSSSTHLPIAGGSSQPAASVLSKRMPPGLHIPPAPTPGSSVALAAAAAAGQLGVAGGQLGVAGGQMPPQLVLVDASTLSGLIGSVPKLQDASSSRARQTMPSAVLKEELRDSLRNKHSNENSSSSYQPSYQQASGSYQPSGGAYQSGNRSSGNDSNSADSTTSDPNARYSITREKNREAAQRCRNKKKRWIQSLEEENRTFKAELKTLKEQLFGLQRQNALLKKQMLEHEKSCPLPPHKRDFYNNLGQLFLESDTTPVSTASELANGLLSSPMTNNNSRMDTDMDSGNGMAAKYTSANEMIAKYTSANEISGNNVLLLPISSSLSRRGVNEVVHEKITLTQEQQMISQALDSFLRQSSESKFMPVLSSNQLSSSTAAVSPLANLLHQSQPPVQLAPNQIDHLQVVSSNQIAGEVAISQSEERSPAESEAEQPVSAL